MAQNESNDTIYFIQVLAGIAILALLVNVISNSAYFLSMCILFACMLGILLVQFRLSTSAMSNSGPGILGIMKRLFHFRTLLVMIVLTGWVFDIYINYYDQIVNNKMPKTFYTASTAYMWIVVAQLLMIIVEVIRTSKDAKDVSDIAKGSNNEIFQKMKKLYSTQQASLNAILTIVNFMLVIVLYINSELFVTDG
tara:strand:+ start:45 stop:629 length:585 start_codon:yes stop_codon:yes gene_type:complete